MHLYILLQSRKGFLDLGSSYVSLQKVVSLCLAFFNTCISKQLLSVSTPLKAYVFKYLDA